MSFGVVVSCEHATKEIPREYQSLFASAEAQAALWSHRGYDAGAKELAELLGATFGVAPHLGTSSRLLCDLNRSYGHPKIHSEFTQSLSASELEHVIEKHWRPYRDAVEKDVASKLNAAKRVLHLSCHSFTPVLDGVPRTVEVGLLYDPKRRHERSLAKIMKEELSQRLAGLRVRCNQPYRGNSDGLASHLRKIHSDERYVGFELEVSHAVVGDVVQWAATQRALVDVMDLAMRRGIKEI
jgi:predicted N-formylglutamate amidohydrolase